MATVYLGIGSNIGNRKNFIKMAIDSLNERGICTEELSSIIETEPVGGPPQEKFLNMVAKATTQLQPVDLLKTLKTIEKKLGRTKNVLNGPRTIDIDILLYDNQTISTPVLTVPHPRMRERDFVMIPLNEIAPHITRLLSVDIPS